MKVFFLKEHSLYKIFKTLEKIPNGKVVQIHIDPEHAFFENERRGQQILELFGKKKIDATFITKNDKNKKHYQKIGMKVEYQEENKFIKTLNLTYLFLFNIKKFHLYVYTKKNLVFYMVFAFEAIFILWIMYLLYTLILPSAKITIYPSHEIETIIYNFRYYPYQNTNYPKESRYLSLPFYTGYIDYKYDMTISTSHLQHIHNPSQGKVKFYNTTNKEYSIVPNTRLETNDGRMFQTKDRFTLPAGTPSTPGEVVINVEAMEKDNNEAYMGARWNIEKGSVMYIKNIKNSFYLKEIYAKAIEDFTGGIYQSEGKVTQEDISLLSEKLYEYITKQKQNIIHKNFALEDGILLPFDELMSLEVQNIQIHNQIGENNTQAQGSIIARMHFFYIKQSELLSTVNTYILQRPSEKIQLITIDQNTLSFFENIKTTDNIYIIPTKIDMIQGYNFNGDINGVLEDIKTKALWKTEKELEKIILWYPEIASTQVKIKPLRYWEIPKLKSRIHIEIK